MGYCLPEIVSWYQKKIGTYDKQPWEKTVEQRILSGFTHVPKKTAKLKTELIDLDLVRGSSFTKAKPKHGIVTVTKFAVVRLLLLPLYTEWWSQQTSPRLVPLLLLLYSLEIVNIGLFCWAIATLPDTLTQGLLASEVIVPGAMMLFLAVLHSEIVSPHSAHHQAELTSVSRPRRVPPKRHRLVRPPSADKYHSECGEANCNNLGDATAKFNSTKRLRSRRLSAEDGSCKIRQPRRSVAWDTSPLDTPRRLIVQSKDGEQSDTLLQEDPSPPPSPTLSTADKVDDDGFESLNSTASSDHSDQGQAKIKSTADPSSEQIRHHWAHNGRKPSIGGYHRTSATGGGDGVSSGETDHKDSDSEEGGPGCAGSGCSAEEPPTERLLVRRRGYQTLATETRRRSTTTRCHQGESSYQSSEDGETCGALTGGCTTSAAEWMGITTNSEDCSDDSLPASADLAEHPFASEFFPSPASAILSPSCASSDKVSCTMWEKREVKKADLSVLDISSAIIARVEAMPENMDYFYGGMVMSMLLGLVPVIYRLGEFAPSLSSSSSSSPPGSTGTGSGAVSSSLAYSDSVCFPPPPVSPSPGLFHFESYIDHFSALVDTAFGDNIWERSISIIGLFERTLLACLFFFLLAVAERTFKQKFLYAKFFSHLTSFRRARKSELPHFRLNKVRNIKTWLSVRSYLKKRGPQHSVDAIVSSVFLITLLLISFLSVELLKDSERLHSNYNIEALAWCIVLGLFLLRFMTLGTKINRKYRNLSVLITEQINLYLQIEQKPNKKEELMVANSVLKLAADLLKELECPYKISGFSANPYLYTITKVVVLSALSGVLSEMLGFKLKLHKIKIK